MVLGDIKVLGRQRTSFKYLKEDLKNNMAQFKSHNKLHTKMFSFSVLLVLVINARGVYDTKDFKFLENQLFTSHQNI